VAKAKAAAVQIEQRNEAAPESKKAVMPKNQSATSRANETEQQSKDDKARIAELMASVENLKEQLVRAQEAKVAGLEGKLEALQRQSEKDKAKIAELTALVETLQEQPAKTEVGTEQVVQEEPQQAETVVEIFTVGEPEATDDESEQTPGQDVVVTATSAPASEDETQDSPETDEPSGLWERESLTNGFGGVTDRLADSGIEFGVGVTNVFQQNVTGGLATGSGVGAYTGSYDVEVGADLEQLFGFEGASLFIHGQGCWPAAEGIDATSVGSVFGVNADAGGYRTFDLIELFYEGALLGDILTVMIGKMDFAGVFETSEYANDEAAQFINGALVNNPTVPLPDYCLGAILSCNVADWWTVTAGVGDAEADGTTTGFGTTFDGDNFFLYVLETAVTPELNSQNGPMPGNYRVGLWHDPQDKTRFSDSATINHDTGFYVSCDQVVRRETDDPEDTQGLGIFGRYGWANPTVSEITDFWSFGCQYQGLIGGRDDDVLGVGVASGIFSNQAPGFTANAETVVEVYYSAAIAPWAIISPSVQYITSPGGDGTVSDAVVIGVRAQITP
jgi:porin